MKRKILMLGLVCAICLSGCNRVDETDTDTNLLNTETENITQTIVLDGQSVDCVLLQENDTDNIVEQATRTFTKDEIQENTELFIRGKIDKIEEYQLNYEDGAHVYGSLISVTLEEDLFYQLSNPKEGDELLIWYEENSYTSSDFADKICCGSEYYWLLKEDGDTLADYVLTTPTDYVTKCDGEPNSEFEQILSTNLIKYEDATIEDRIACFLSYSENDDRQLASISDFDLSDKIIEIFNGGTFTDTLDSNQYTTASFNLAGIPGQENEAEVKACVLWYYYYVVDIDDDNELELIYLIADSYRSAEYYLVLDEADDQVYAYHLGTRELGWIYQDGTFGRHMGLMSYDSNLYRLSLDNSSCEYVTVGDQSSAGEMATVYVEE